MKRFFKKLALGTVGIICAISACCLDSADFGLFFGLFNITAIILLGYLHIVQKIERGEFVWSKK